MNRIGLYAKHQQSPLKALGMGRWVGLALGLSWLSGCFLVPMEQRLAPIEDQCQRQWLRPVFDPIRDKVQLLPQQQGASNYLFINEKATEEQKPLIKRMAELLDECQSQRAAVTYEYNERQSLRENAQKVADLENLMQVHDGHITWGEFTRRRYALIAKQQVAAQAERERIRQEYAERALQREAVQAEQHEQASERMEQLRSRYQTLAILRSRNADTTPLTERWPIESGLREQYKRFFRSLRDDGYIIDYTCKNQECTVYY